MLLIFYLLLPQVLFFVYSPYLIVVYADDNNAYHPKQFDWKFYLLNNPDLVDIGILMKEHAVEHYHNIGEIENRWGIPDILPSLIQCERYRKAIERDEVFSKHCLSLKNRIEFSSSNDLSLIDMILTIAICQYNLYESKNVTVERKILVTLRLQPHQRSSLLRPPQRSRNLSPKDPL